MGNPWLQSVGRHNVKRGMLARTVSIDDDDEEEEEDFRVRL